MRPLTADDLRYQPKSGGLAGEEALVASTIAREFAYKLQAAKERSRTELGRLSPDERRKVEQMPCTVGNRYLARRVDRLPDHGRHRRDPGEDCDRVSRP
jgi:hypothetical protein